MRHLYLLLDAEARLPGSCSRGACAACSSACAWQQQQGTLASTHAIRSKHVLRLSCISIFHVILPSQADSSVQGPAPPSTRNYNLGKVLLTALLPTFHIVSFQVRRQQHEGYLMYQPSFWPHVLFLYCWPCLPAGVVHLYAGHAAPNPGAAQV